MAAALLSSLQGVSAFSNTSPFFLVTSSECVLLSPRSSCTLTTAEFVRVAKDVLSQCSSDGYVIATQPGVHVSDFRNGHAGAMAVEEVGGWPGMPHLKRALSGNGRSLVVPFTRGEREVDGLGEVNGVAEVLGEWVREKCGGEVVRVDASTGTFERFGDMKPKVMMVNFEPLDESDKEVRAKELADTDAFLFSLLESFPSTRYTLIYTSTPRITVPNHPSSKLQAPQTQDELRRRFVILDKKLKHGDVNTTIPVTGSLFKKYAFFTPGIWMGYLAAFFLISIVYVGLNALTSLKVSYGAFEKEMGPAAQKKQQ
ncbi:BIG1-domain-containing protein [Terfezia boudieri ATCC MYA-4762]|uniref:Protein BIG1 n=1 Tax=Terfezia boudieri ATCC MYA-4762 TaxID=1051890 RepID=A0A3N4LPM4_9PEZI|nr:BIG1-domain-containing protein [Terfezia boudieri ATCC MYA-4762]